MSDLDKTAPGVPRAIRSDITGQTRAIKRRKPTTLEMLRAVGWMPIAGLGIVVAGVVACAALGQTELAALLAGVICPNPLTVLERRGDR